MSGDTSCDTREALAEAFRPGSELRALWLGAPSDDAMAAVVDRTGFHPSFVRLLPAIGGYEGGEESSRFYGELLEVMPFGQAGADVVRAWYLDCWSLPGNGIAAGLGELAQDPAAARMMELVRDSISAPVPPKTWRTARAALAVALGDAPFAEPMLAMAWDLDAVPGASADVFYGWQSAVYQATRAELNWTDADDAIVRPIFEEFSARAVVELGEPTKEDTGWMQRFRERITSYWAEREDLAELNARSHTLEQKTASTRAAMVAAARSMLIARAKKATRTADRP